MFIRLRVDSGGRLPFPFLNLASSISIPYTGTCVRICPLLPVLSALVQIPSAEGHAPVRAQALVPSVPSEGDHFLLFRSQRTYYLPGLLCLSLCLRILPGSLLPSVPSVQLAPSLVCMKKGPHTPPDKLRAGLRNSETKSNHMGQSEHKNPELKVRCGR